MGIRKSEQFGRKKMLLIFIRKETWSGLYNGK